ncbi:MAG: hypothetical protein NC225_07030 [Clostridium sp.]|nr:hypothetical protein [Clostridium sp.]MCM1459244.1 hypothetical protein [Bacteroides sp.]
MGKLKYLVNRIVKMDYKGMFATVKRVHKASGKNSLYLFLDMIYSGFKYQAGYMDYEMFDMYALNQSERKKILTRGKNDAYVARLNDREARQMFKDKPSFNQRFKEYIGRDWFLIDGKNEKEFEEFLKGRDKVIIKPVGLCCGQGIEIVSLADKKTKEFYEYLIKTDRPLVEQVLEQNEEMSKLYPNAVNTLRIVTVVSDKGTVSVVGTYIRIGAGGNDVDNFNHGGVTAPVNRKTGVIEHKARNKETKYFEKHPDTGAPIVGFQVPHWQEVIAFAKKMAKEVDNVRYVGWDICITKTGLAVVEANEYPGNDLYQIPKENIGTCNIIDAALAR